MLNEITDLLSNLPGVINTAVLCKEDIPEIRKGEAENEKQQLVPLVNLGVNQIVQREHVVVFIKDTRFRPPPCPTIYLVEERTAGPGVPETEYLKVGGRYYHIVGEEVMGTGRTYKEEHMFIQKGFVLFPGRRINSRDIPAYFLIPPIPFPELDNFAGISEITNIMSVSPSTVCDDFLRDRYNLSKQPEYASILVGFDTA